MERKPMDINSLLQRKVAQLTKVVAHLNNRSEDLQDEIAVLRLGPVSGTLTEVVIQTDPVDGSGANALVEVLRTEVDLAVKRASAAREEAAESWEKARKEADTRWSLRVSTLESALERMESGARAEITSLRRLLDDSRGSLISQRATHVRELEAAVNEAVNAERERCGTLLEGERKERAKDAQEWNEKLIKVKMGGESMVASLTAQLDVLAGGARLSEEEQRTSRARALALASELEETKALLDNISSERNELTTQFGALQIACAELKAALALQASAHKAELASGEESSALATAAALAAAGAEFEQTMRRERERAIAAAAAAQASSVAIAEGAARVAEQFRASMEASAQELSASKERELELTSQMRKIAAGESAAKTALTSLQGELAALSTQGVEERARDRVRIGALEEEVRELHTLLCSTRDELSRSSQALEVSRSTMNEAGALAKQALQAALDGEVVTRERLLEEHRHALIAAANEAAAQESHWASKFESIAVEHASALERARREGVQRAEAVKVEGQELVHIMNRALREGALALEEKNKELERMAALVNSSMKDAKSAGDNLASLTVRLAEVEASLAASQVSATAWETSAKNLSERLVETKTALENSAREVAAREAEISRLQQSALAGTEELRLALTAAEARREKILAEGAEERSKDRARWEAEAEAEAVRERSRVAAAIKEVQDSAAAAIKEARDSAAAAATLAVAKQAALEADIRSMGARVKELEDAALLLHEGLRKGSVALEAAQNGWAEERQRSERLEISVQAATAQGFQEKEKASAQTALVQEELTRERARAESYECRLTELKNRCDELELAAAAVEPLKQKVENALNSARDSAALAQSLAQEHAGVKTEYAKATELLDHMGSARLESLKETSELYAQVEDLKAKLASKESRPEDLERIARLVSVCKVAEVEVERMAEEAKLLRLELANRDVNYTKVFKGGGDGNVSAAASDRKPPRGATTLGAAGLQGGGGGEGSSTPSRPGRTPSRETAAAAVPGGSGLKAVASLKRF